MKFLLLLLFSCINALLYRAGGMGKEDENQPRWIPKFLRNTKTRDWGCPLIFLLFYYLLTDKFNLWAYLFTFGLMFGALSTYWDSFPPNKGKDNFFHHGTGIGVATFPLIILGISLWQIVFYAISLGLMMGLWSEFITSDVLEETGRGAFIILLLPIII